jgi:hypothetical protein
MPLLNHNAMTRQRQFTKKRFYFFATAVAVYALLWFVTHRIGAPQVRSAVVEVIQKPSGSTDVSQRIDERVAGPVYWCVASAYAPLMVRVEYGWQSGPLYGDGGSALYLWLFGRAFRIHELEHWAS